ncbi:MAG TPA: tetratricopeptide repeat protein [Gemmatimonadales bacterium]
MIRPPLLALVAVLALPLAASRCPLAAQDNPTLRRASKAYNDLSFAQAITLVRQATRERLGSNDQARAYELLGFAYASLDSTRQATEAFKQALLLNPDRALDAARVSPKITSAFALALAQVLVLRDLRIDTSEFVAGVGSLPIRFTVTRTARLRTRLVGPGGEITVDSALGEGAVRLQWNGLLAGGRPPARGVYRVIVEASAGRDSYAASLPFRIDAGAVDTLAHLTSLPGYDLLPETVVPPRSWKPVGLALMATSVALGSSLALENSKLGGGGRREILGIGTGAALVGLLATMKKPAPVPARANILYNSLVREQLARRNAEIAAENASRRRQVKLAIVPQPRSGGKS